MGLTFLNGLFAFALAGVALPLIIHLLNRRRTKRLSFSSVRFLEEVSRRQRRRIQVRQWLLLALRMLIVALIALAMMRPAFRTGSGSGSTSAVVLFDNSFSMNAITPDGSRREDALARLGALSPSFGRGDRTQLLYATDPPASAFDGGVEEFGRITATAARAPTSYMPMAVRAGLRRALDELGSGGALNRELYIVSDFQAADWSEETELPDIPDGVRVYLLPVGSTSLPNVAIHQATFVPARSGDGSAGAVRVGIANYADHALTNYPIQVFAGERVVAEGPISVPLGEIATTDLPLLRTGVDEDVFQVRIAEDALADDDVAWVVPGERQSVRVLVVHGGDADAAVNEPFVRLALDPPGQAGDRIFTVTEIPLRDLPIQTNLDYDVFILNNVERLSQGAQSKLELAHRDGAGIFIALGDRVDLPYYNNHVLVDLLDVSLEEAESANGSFFTLRPEVVGHPIFDGFKVSVDEQLTRARFVKVVRGDVGPGARTLATLGNHPALIEGDRVLLWTSSLDMRWGNFPTGGSFLPFLHQAVLTLASKAVGARQAVAGAPLVLDLDAGEVSGDVTAFAPSGSELRVTSRTESGRVQITTDPVPSPGVVRLVSAERPFRFVPVHFDTGESRLEQLDPASIATRLGERAQVLSAGDRVTDRIREDRQGREIWQELLLAAFLLLIAETILGRVKLA